jgi:hypothetical protein
MYFSAKRRFNPGTSDSQLNGENSNELLFMVGTPNILFPLVAYHERVLIKFNTYFPGVFPYPEKGARKTKSKTLGLYLGTA